MEEKKSGKRMEEIKSKREKFPPSTSYFIGEGLG